MFYSKPVKIHSSQMNYRDKRTTLFDRKQAENEKIARTPPSLTTGVIKGEVTPRVREITRFEDYVCSLQHRHKSFVKTTPEINQSYFWKLFVFIIILPKYLFFYKFLQILVGLFFRMFDIPSILFFNNSI